MAQITIQYYAILREQRGVSEETVESSAKNLEELYVDLSSRFKFTLPASSIRYAINEEFVSADRTLKDNDVVVFIAPVAGG